MTSLVSKRVLLLLSLFCLILFYYCSLPLGYIQADGITLSMAKDIYDGTYSQVMTGFLHSSFFVRIISFLIPFLHEPLWLPRAVTKAGGILCIMFTYFFAKKTYNEIIALSSAGLFATSLWHYQITHSGLEMFTPLFVVALLYCYVLFIHSGKLRYMALCGMCAAFGVLSQPVVSSLLFVPFFHAWVSNGFKKAVKQGCVLLFAFGAAISPVACYLTANRAAFGKEIYYYVFLGKPAREFRMFLAGGFFAEMKENFLEVVRGAAFCLSLNSSARHLFYSLPFLLFICSMMYFVVVFLRKKSRTEDILIVSWLAVCTVTLTFLSPWTSKIQFPQGSAGMRPPWYYSVFFPLPYIMTAKMLCDVYASFTQKIRRAVLIPLVLVFAQHLTGIYALFHPAENLETKAYAHVLKYAKPGTLMMSNIPPGDYRLIKNFSYLIRPSETFIKNNYADLEALYSINAVYSVFLYQSQASRTLLLAHPLENSKAFIANFLSFDNLPIVPLPLLKQFESAPGGKIEDVYYMLYEGDCKESLSCKFDYPNSPFFMDVQLFHFSNPGFTPVKTWESKISKSKIELFHFKLHRRNYTHVRFSFQKKGALPASNAFPISQGNIYIPWIGFGWTHNAGLQFFSFSSNEGSTSALGTFLQNNFRVDVVNGKYKVKARFAQKPDSRMPEIIIEGKKIKSGDFKSATSMKPWMEIHLETTSAVNDNSLDIAFKPTKKSHRQWGIKELEIQKL